MNELATKYNPADVEEKWYAYWLKNGLFKSKPDGREPYTVVIPPPNVTGILHMGHMLNNTIQDILVRRARMEGKNACWVPGTDHASIATEAKVVNKLAAQGIKKSDLSREEFLKYAWEWKEEHGGIILKQLQKLGASCDWDRTAFTMDEIRSESVLKVFVDLYNKGLIYRGVRMVNWDPKALTALSDEEVIYKDEHSKLYYLRYFIEGEDKYIIVATTRPETILGDTAVCVNPNDPRYSFLKGKKVIIPLVNRVVPIIMDDYVDIEFGTGCLKVTPAHDVNDYMLGEKYNLPSIDIFNDNGTISEAGGLYVGMDRFDVRKQIAKDLQKAGLLEKALRFFWIAAMLRVARDTITGQRRKMTPERWRSAAVMTFGGPKGTITLSLMFTIPYYIAGGAPFPMRDELIFIASGVIIVTLLLANFLLPLLAPNRGKDPSAEMIPVTIDVLRATVEELTGRITPENRRAILMVIDQYTKRIGRLQQRIGDTDPQGFEQLQIEALHWEKEFVRDRLADTKAHPAADTATQELNVEACERMLDQIMNTLRHTSTDPTSGHAVSQIRGRLRMFQRQMSNYAKRTVSKIRHTTPLVSEDQIFARTRELQVEAIHHVIGRLIDEMGQDTYNTEHCSALLLDYRRAEASLQARPTMSGTTETITQVEDVKRESYGIELGMIQDMYEAGDINRAQARSLRRNIYVMQVDADSGI